ncbi:hypothetical protein VNO80_10092 [Phaseolus coccineus]|uniref:Uncharacterized protein n=1 Tax=Phaseolus coccineus TaxID=3886 RepID=A0AAN9N7G5_PHACN
MYGIYNYDKHERTERGSGPAPAPLINLNTLSLAHITMIKKSKLLQAHKDATFRFCFTSATVALRNHRCLYSSIVLQMIIWSHQKETALLKPPEVLAQKQTLLEYTAALCSNHLKMKVFLL